MPVPRSPVRDGGMPPLVIEGGNGSSVGSKASGRDAQRNVPLSARSIASAISVHINSYAYLSDRAYDFFNARSAWLRRTQDEREDGKGEEAAMKVRAHGIIIRCLVLSITLKEDIPIES